ARRRPIQRLEPTPPMHEGAAPPGTAPSYRFGSEGSAELRDVLRRRALLALHDVELDPLALAQGLEARPLDRRMVDEAVLVTAVRGDEPEALGVVEPLHRSGGTHAPTPCTVPLVSGSGTTVPPDHFSRVTAPRAGHRF